MERLKTYFTIEIVRRRHHAWIMQNKWFLDDTVVVTHSWRRPRVLVSIHILCTIHLDIKFEIMLSAPNTGNRFLDSLYSYNFILRGNTLSRYQLIESNDYKKIFPSLWWYVVKSEFRKFFWEMEIWKFFKFLIFISLFLLIHPKIK